MHSVDHPNDITSVNTFETCIIIKGQTRWCHSH